MAFSQSPPPLVGYSTIFFCGYDAHLVAGIWTSSVCVQHKGNKDTTKVICGKDVAVMNSIVPNGRAPRVLYIPLLACKVQLHLKIQLC